MHPFNEHLPLCREEEASDRGRMHKVEALCDILDAALLVLPEWMSHLVVAISFAPSQENLSQVLLSPNHLDQMLKP